VFERRLTFTREASDHYRVILTNAEEQPPFFELLEVDLANVIEDFLKAFPV